MLVAVLALVVVAGAVAGTLRTLAGPPAVPSADANRPGDVLLVPGYSGSTIALDALAGRIAAAGGSGFHPIVVRLAGDGTGDLQVQANVLNGYVNQALARGSGGVSIGHGQLPTAPLVVGIVLRTLHSAALSSPRPADCRSLQALGGSGS